VRARHLRSAFDEAFPASLPFPEWSRELLDRLGCDQPTPVVVPQCGQAHFVKPRTQGRKG
jgi:hypothetical protein